MSEWKLGHDSLILSSTNKWLYAELQINGIIENISKILFLFLNKNIHCDPSLE